MKYILLLSFLLFLGCYPTEDLCTSEECAAIGTTEQAAQCEACDPGEPPPPSAPTGNIIDNGTFMGLSQAGVSGWSIINATRYTEVPYTGDSAQFDCRPATPTDAGGGCCWNHSVSWWDVDEGYPNPYANFHDYSSGCALASTKKDVFLGYKLKVTLNYSTNNTIEPAPVEGDELGVRVRWYDASGNLIGATTAIRFFWHTHGENVTPSATVYPPSNAKQFDLIIGKFTPGNMADTSFDDVKVIHVK